MAAPGTAGWDRKQARRVERQMRRDAYLSAGLQGLAGLFGTLGQARRQRESAAEEAATAELMARALRSEDPYAEIGTALESREPAPGYWERFGATFTGGLPRGAGQPSPQRMMGLIQAFGPQVQAREQMAADRAQSAALASAYQQASTAVDPTEAWIQAGPGLPPGEFERGWRESFSPSARLDRRIKELTEQKEREAATKRVDEAHREAVHEQELSNIYSRLMESSPQNLPKILSGIGKAKGLLPESKKKAIETAQDLIKMHKEFQPEAGEDEWGTVSQKLLRLNTVRNMMAGREVDAIKAQMWADLIQDERAIRRLVDAGMSMEEVQEMARMALEGGAPPKEFREQLKTIEQVLLDEVNEYATKKKSKGGDVPPGHKDFVGPVDAKTQIIQMSYEVPDDKVQEAAPIIYGTPPWDTKTPNQRLQALRTLIGKK